MATRRGGSVEPGSRDRVITIQQRSATDTPDASSGEPTETWTTLVANMPASKTSVSGWERFRVDQTSARFDTIWQINWRNDMDPELLDVPKLRRIIWGTRILDIVEATEVGRREAIDLMTIASAGI